MGKLKDLAAIITAIAMITMGAYFPKMISAALDREHTGHMSYNAISPIRLEINRDIPMLGKLAILSKLDSSIELSESKAKMTKEEVMDAVYEGIQPYIDALLIAYSGKDVLMYPSLLLQAEGNQDLQSIVWFVTIVGDPANYTFLELIVDDETGNILMISFTYETLEGNLVGMEALTAFADIYFTGMGLDDYAQFIVRDLEYAYVGDNANATRYRFGDAVYGEVGIDLYVHEHGFYVEFPSI